MKVIHYHFSILSTQIWNCDKCYAFLHMSCILHWINDSLSYKRAKGIIPIWAWYVFIITTKRTFPRTRHQNFNTNKNVHITVQNAVWNTIRLRFQDRTNASVKRLWILRINPGLFHTPAVKRAANFCNQNVVISACCSAILVHVHLAPRWCPLNVTVASYRRNRDVAMRKIGAAELSATKSMNLARTVVTACVTLANVPLAKRYYY